MANVVQFQPTMFVDIDPATGAQTATYFGYRIFDDYDRAYSNTMDPEDFENLTAQSAWEIIRNDHADDDFARTVSDKGGFIFGREYVEISSLE